MCQFGLYGLQQGLSNVKKKKNCSGKIKKYRNALQTLICSCPGAQE